MGERIFMKARISICLAAIAAVSLGTSQAGPSSILEEPVIIPEEEAGLSFRIAPYLWGTWLDGTMGIGGNLTDVNVGFDDILKNLDFAAMGALELRNGRWGLGADLFYAEVSVEGQTPLGIFFTDARLKQRQFIGNFTASYAVYEDHSRVFDLFAGARVNYINLKMTLSGGPTPRISLSDDVTWVDPIIGGRYRASITDRWFYQIGGDIGGFGINSDLTWQAQGMLGYEFNELFSMGLGYRALGTDYSKDGFLYDIVSHGPVLGFEFKF